MKVLLATHVLLWAASDPERLGGGRELLADADRRLVSAASVWEMSIKQALGKLGLATRSTGCSSRKRSWREHCS